MHKKKYYSATRLKHFILHRKSLIILTSKYEANKSIHKRHDSVYSYALLKAIDIF